MLTVAVKCCPLDGWCVGGSIRPIEAHRLIVVADFEIPAGILDWETDDQGTEMRGGFGCIDVCAEMTRRSLIDLVLKLVEMKGG